MPPRITWKQVMAWRVRRHRLGERVPRDRLLDVVSELCGLHAQVMSSAELAAWARLDDVTPADVRDALWKERTLVKTWAMRGTLHVLPSSEYAMWQAALGTYNHYLRPSWSKYFGVTPAQLDTITEAVAQALEGRTLTREELADEVARLTRTKRLSETLRESWGAVLKPCSFRGVLCFAPSEGQTVRFTSPRTWLKVTGPPPDPIEAVRDVIRRFLATYGPTSRDEVARWWAGLSPAGAEKTIRSLGDEVAPVEIEGTKAWALAEQVDGVATSRPAGSVRLLPAFDHYVIGATKHTANMMSGDHHARVHRAAGWVSPVLLVDGRIDGVWTHERKGKRLLVTIEPFAKVPNRVRHKAKEEAERLAVFLGGELDLTWNP